MTKVIGKLVLCEGCRRPIREGDSQRIINGFTLHSESHCLDEYSLKVESGVIKTPYTLVMGSGKPNNKGKKKVK